MNKEDGIFFRHNKLNDYFLPTLEGDDSFW